MHVLTVFFKINYRPYLMCGCRAVNETSCPKNSYKFPNFYETVERKRRWYDALTMAYIWSDIILTYESILWAQKTLWNLKQIAVSSISTAEDINDMIRPCHCWLQSWHMRPFNVNKCNVGDTLLPHGAAEVRFQSAQRRVVALLNTI